MAAGVLPRLEMIADEDRVEPDLLGQAGKVQQLARSELFGRRLVSELQQWLLLGLGWLPLTLPVPGSLAGRGGGLRGLSQVYTFASTSSRKRRIFVSIASVVAPSKLKSTKPTPKSRNARRSATTSAVSPENSRRSPSSARSGRDLPQLVMR